MLNYKKTVIKFSLCLRVQEKNYKQNSEPFLFMYNAKIGKWNKR